ncbi:hypothetical protein [Acidithiobacillus sulfuriphilus]|uniref:Uncharacterized protein n=2 Tax=Acidithiobacillus sulfuriphilus TaxID=1867749 RepID=A0A3M8QQN2_9PROT|nr:hypothetical protein [Acidithiobacillus sulfuriphilus]RNF57802.1 hypothetical protein EC580_14360 [Acidithiobacillus sulfuriphilus]
MATMQNRFYIFIPEYRPSRGEGLMPRLLLSGLLALSAIAVILERHQPPLAAQEYIAAWIQETERIGDLNYPGVLSDFGASGGVGSSVLGGQGATPYIPQTASINFNNANIQTSIGLAGYQLLVPETPPYEQLPHAYLDGYWRIDRSASYRPHPAGPARPIYTGHQW